MSMVDESSEGTAERRRSFVLLRLTLFIATAYLLLAQTGFAGVTFGVALLVLLALISNGALLILPPAWFDSEPFIGAVLLLDTAWITACLLWSDAFGPEIFYIYFFLLFLATIGENLRLIALGAVIVASAYAYGISTVAGADSFLQPAAMIRIPFLFAVAIFYGYLVERVRRERRRRLAEHESVRELDEARKGLEEVNQELTRLNQMKSDFVSTVSHELKTPLTSIKNSLALLRGDKAGPLNETQVRFLEMAQRNADRLARIVDDILDLSKLDAGKLAFRFGDVDAGESLRQAAVAFEGQAQAGGIELRVEISANLPRVWADAARLDQVLANLLSNALKFTAAGGLVTLVARPDDAGVEITIADTGIGIPPEDQDRVFEPFFQSRDSLTNKARGTGLGLGIARDLVRAHGSDLRLSSQPGQGTRLTFRLPAWSYRVEELAEFEVSVRGFRQFPYFALLAIQLEDVASAPLGAEIPVVRSELEVLQRVVLRVLPRALDILTPQPAHGRLLVTLLGTPRGGGETVRTRLQRAFEEEEQLNPGGPSGRARVFGPRCFPEDGSSAIELLRGFAEVTDPTRP